MHTAFSNCSEEGLLMVAELEPLTAAASLVEHRLYLGAWASVVVALGLGSSGTRA